MLALNTLFTMPAPNDEGADSHETLYRIAVQHTERGNKAISRLNEF